MNEKMNVFINSDTFHYITKTLLYNFDPIKPHFYIVKLGFTGVYIIFHISAQKHRLWVLVRTASPLNIFIYLIVKFSIYLNRHVFVMTTNMQLDFVMISRKEREKERQNEKKGGRNDGRKERRKRRKERSKEYRERKRGSKKYKL